MNPEEFDNRLRASFRDEYAPPKEQLWQNIQQGLDQGAKKPMWYWLAPVLIVVVAGLSWLAASLVGGHAGDKVVESAPVQQVAPAQVNPSTDSNASKESQSNAVAAPKDNNAVDHTAQNAAQGNTNNNNQGRVDQSTSRAANARETIARHSRENTGNNDRASRNGNNATRSSRDNHDGIGNSLAEMIGGNNTSAQGSPRHSNAGTMSEDINKENNVPDIESAEIGARNFPNFRKSFKFNEDQKSYFAIKPIKLAENKQGSTSKKSEFAPPNEDSKWWFSFGIGPQLAFNRLSVNNDSQAYIHKDLWDKKKNVTHNGAGLNMHGSVLYKIAKTDKYSLSFETGLFFSTRTEDIKMNESTYNIEHRAANNQIDTYARFKVYITYKGDTTWFDATQAFTSIATNKYKVLTVPVRFNYERRITQNSFFSVGVGGGISMISSKTTTHYNLVDEKDKVMSASTHMTASWNTSLAFYTNYNAIGQIGVYTTFNSYMSPWMVSNKQYGIKMSDLQFGLMFRTPLTR